MYNDTHTVIRYNDIQHVRQPHESYGFLRQSTLRYSKKKDTNSNTVQSKHNMFNNVNLLHVSVKSNHHQADISVHGHDMFSVIL